MGQRYPMLRAFLLAEPSEYERIRHGNGPSASEYNNNNKSAFVSSTVMYSGKRKHEDDENTSPKKILIKSKPLNLARFQDKSFIRLLNAMSRKMDEDMSHKTTSNTNQSAASSCKLTQSKGSLTRSSTWSNIHAQKDELQIAEMKSYKSNVKTLDPALGKDGAIQKTQSTPFIASKK
ncbi:unnamed protein product [Euphydryas editha]|uniref:Uncharacterized protein n=1 Tax=Euphydryas editha TaxID=104508 RepID=A0AAU9VBN3_EUPED|nr:unnamed protein product [Euphydryas editha]